MGFTIFTSSGTFTPSDYGLKTGDCIHIICVGGGGGGASVMTPISTGSANWTQIAGSAGGTSSFGSVVSSAGGKPGPANSNPANGAPSPAYVAGSCTGGSGIHGNKIYALIAGASKSAPSAGSGGDGWLPSLGFSPQDGISTIWLKPNLDIPSTSESYTYDFTIPYRIIPYAALSQVTLAAEQAARTGTRGGIGGFQNTSSSYISYSGAPGVGYGAGGGGSVGGPYASAGGSGGVINHKDYVLTSTSGIAVTVGNGGAGGTNSYVTASGTGYGGCAGGGGARGCVAIFW